MNIITIFTRSCEFIQAKWDVLEKRDFDCTFTRFGGPKYVTDVHWFSKVSIREVKHFDRDLVFIHSSLNS